jgi:beta-galactosidase/beta-glucuronidase
MAILSSHWAASVDPERPRQEYPRPSLVRDRWLCLNGRWEYAIRGEGEKPIGSDGHIVVPFPVESALSEVERPLGPGNVLWYRQALSLPEGFRGERILLRVEAADWECRAYVNGRMAGSHRGGYAPFSLDITELLDGGSSQELVLEVRDPSDAGVQCRGKQSLQPRGIWYTASSGIWGTVWLEPAPAARIDRILARVPPGAAAKDGRLLVKARLAVPSGDRSTHHLRIAAMAGGEILARAEASAEGGTIEVELAVPEAHPWSPEEPFLYDLELDLDGADRVGSYAAIRTVGLGLDSSGRRRIFLNGRPYYNNGVLDQGYWPEGIYSAPTDEALASDIAMAKQLGFNTIRKHAKVESERWYWHCDRIGMLVWQDIPSGGAPMRFLYSAILGFAGLALRDDRRLLRFGREDAAGRADFEREIEEIVGFIEPFPCVVVWVPFNEGWGQFESSRIAAALAERDPSRLVDAASGWYDAGAGSLASRHDYSRMPRAPSRVSAGIRAGARAAALTEYGGLTLKVEGHSTDDERQFGYAGASDREALARGYERLAARLERLARQGLAASVYTQITDVEIERNGLVTYDREVLKAELSRVREANLSLTRAGSEAP